MNYFFHEMDHVKLMCKHHHHSTGGCPHQMHNPPQFTWVTVPGQNLRVGQTSSARLSQVRFEGPGNITSIVIVTDQQADPSPAKVFEDLNHCTHLAQNRNCSTVVLLPRTERLYWHFYQMFYLERITWNCSKEWGELFPIAQAGTGGKVTHLMKQAESCK